MTGSEKVESLFDQLIERFLELDSDEKDQVIESHKQTREDLVRIIDVENDDASTPKTFLTGSYSRGTIIRPPKDVDFFVVLSQEYLGKEKEITSDELLRFVAEKLKILFPERNISYKGDEKSEDDIVIQNSAVKIPLENGLDLDVVPAFSYYSKYKIPNLQEGKLIVSSPVLHKDYINELNTKTAAGDKKYLKNIIKLVKYWNRTRLESQDLDFKSFHLELVVCDILKEDLISGYLVGLKAVFDNLDKYLQVGIISDPANTDRFVDDYINKYEHAELDRVRQEIMMVKLSLGDVAFNLTSGSNEMEKLIETVGKVFPSFGETDEYEESLESNYAVSIYAKRDIQEDGKFTEHCKSSGRAIAKNNWLLFKIDHHKSTLPQNYSVKWKITNTGKEATDAGDLRGVLYESNKANNSRQEHTRYKGTHFVECFVRDEDQKKTVARSIMQVVVK